MKEFVVCMCDADPDMWPTYNTFNRENITANNESEAILKYKQLHNGNWWILVDFA